MIRVPTHFHEHRPTNDSSPLVCVATVFDCIMPGQDRTTHMVRFEGGVYAIVLHRALELLKPSVRGTMSKNITLEVDHNCTHLLFEGDASAPNAMRDALHGAGVDVDICQLKCLPGKEAKFQLTL